jgi:alpha-L-rhamnosidase
VTPAGRLLSDAQTAYTLAIEFGLLTDPGQRQYAAERLSVLVRTNGYHIGTGFVGTPLICDALCNTGDYEAAYRLLLQRECPSWLYPVTMGATTIWERWDSMLPDGSVNPGEMTSFNHYALGAVADWLHRRVGGLAHAQPGYRQIAVQPRPGGGLTHASARHLTPYGMAECTWKIQDGKMDVKVIVPPNTTAIVSLPGYKGELLVVESGTHSWSYAYKDPDVRPPLSIDHTIGEISEDPDAWAAVKKVLDRLIPHNGFTLYVLRNQSKRKLRDGLATLENADEVITAVTDAFAGLDHKTMTNA